MKTALLLFALVLLISTAITAIKSSFTLGIVICALMSLFFGTSAVFADLLLRSRVLTGLYIAVMVFCVVCPSVFLISGSSDSATYDEDVLIVLGCGLRGSAPGRQLTKRLDAALEYCDKNVDCVILVSGGQGHNESTSEAVAMREYLISHGVDEKRIICEDRSHSTSTNFANSKAILDEMMGEDHTCCFVTTDYHVLRSSFTAEKNGLKCTHIHSAVDWYAVLPNTMREFVSTVVYLFY